MILKTNEQKERDDVSKWPQTDQVFEKPNVKFDSHDWIQQGYYLIDSCPNCPRQAVAIPYGKMLTKEGGKYKLVEEVR